MVDKRHLPSYMDMISLLTVLAGAILFWNTSGGLQISWIKTGAGIDFTILHPARTPPGRAGRQIDRR
jgi:hypothetical protein